MQESTPPSSRSKGVLVLCPAPLLAKGGRSEELVMSSLPPIRQKRGEELISRSTSVLTDRHTYTQPRSVHSEGGKEKGGRRDRDTAKSVDQGDREPYLEVDTVEESERGGAHETGQG